MAKAKPAHQASQPPSLTAKSRTVTQPPKPLEPEAPVVRAARPIKVRAKEMGYYDHARRRPGDVFYIADAQAFSHRWMEMVDERTPERLTTAKQALEQAHDEILAGRTPGPSSNDEAI